MSSKPTGEAAPAEPEPAGVVAEEPVPEGSPPGTITLEDLQDDPEVSLFIANADRVMEGLGYTEHGFRHANLVAKIAYNVLHRLGFDDDTLKKLRSAYRYLTQSKLNTSQAIVRIEQDASLACPERLVEAKCDRSGSA